MYRLKNKIFDYNYKHMHVMNELFRKIKLIKFKKN